jgi:hypothetical protein
VEWVDARIVRDLAKEDNNEYVEVNKDEQVDTDKDDGPNFVDTDSDRDTHDDWKNTVIYTFIFRACSTINIGSGYYLNWRLWSCWFIANSSIIKSPNMMSFMTI